VRACTAGCKWSGYLPATPPSNGPEQCDKGTGKQQRRLQRLQPGLHPRPPSAATAPPTPTNGEECDDAANNGTPGSKCTTTCKLKCGNGTPDPGEQCGNGTVNNVGGLRQVHDGLQAGPRCGDGIRSRQRGLRRRQERRQLRHLQPMCVLAPRCGDGVIQSRTARVRQRPMNMSKPYGKNLCDLRCQIAPYCGDKQVDSPQEKCDDGMNTGQPGSCKPTARTYVPLPPAATASARPV
jgi:hypothetical protein